MLSPHYNRSVIWLLSSVMAVASASAAADVSFDIPTASSQQDKPLNVGRNKSALDNSFNLGLGYSIVDGDRVSLGVGVNAGFDPMDGEEGDISLGPSLFGNYEILDGLKLGLQGSFNYRQNSDQPDDGVGQQDPESKDLSYDLSLSLEPSAVFKRPVFRNIHVTAGMTDQLPLDEKSSRDDKPLDFGDDARFYIDFDYRY